MEFCNQCNRATLAAHTATALLTAASLLAATLASSDASARETPTAPAGEETATAPSDRGFYVGASLFVGPGVDYRTDTGFEVEYLFAQGVDLSAGYVAGPLRIEGSLLYQRYHVEDIAEGASGIPVAQYGGWMDTGALMANAFVDIGPASGGVRPYLGVGGGIGRIEAVLAQSNCVFACALTVPLANTSDNVALWQGMAGVSFKSPDRNQGLILDLGYRYLRSEDMHFRLVDGTPFTHEGLKSHIFEARVRIVFP